METTNAIVPSTVLLVPGHLTRPTSLPTTEACTRLSVGRQEPSRTSTHERISDSKNENSREPVHSSPLQPETSRATCEEVEVTEDDRATVLGVDKLGEEDVERCADGIERKVACVL